MCSLIGNVASLGFPFCPRGLLVTRAMCVATPVLPPNDSDSPASALVNTCAACQLPVSRLVVLPGKLCCVEMCFLVLGHVVSANVWVGQCELAACGLRHILLCLEACMSNDAR